MKSPERLFILADEFTHMTLNAQSPNFPAVMADIHKANALESACDAIRSLHPMPIGDVLEVLRALEFACDGDSSVQLQEVRESLEVEQKHVERILA